MHTHYFLALVLPDEVKDALREWREQHPLPFQTDVHRDDYHITLAFLGSVDPAVLTVLPQELERILRGHAAFPLVLRGLGTFGAPAQPRIFWAGVTEPPALFTLQSEIAAGCRRLGLPLETRPYRPHITLARRWRGGHSYVPPAVSLPEIAFAADAVALYTTHRDRVPKYEALRTIFLEKK